MVHFLKIEKMYFFKKCSILDRILWYLANPLKDIGWVCFLEFSHGDRIPEETPIVPSKEWKSG
jgi:hypothetical protein